MTDKKKYKSIIVTNETHEVIKKLADQDNRSISMFLKNLVSKYASENLDEDINLDENNKKSLKGLDFLNNFNEFELKNILKLISGSGLNKRQEFILRKIIVDDSSYESIGDELDISRQRVHQIYTNTIDQIRMYLISLDINPTGENFTY